MAETKAKAKSNGKAPGTAKKDAEGARSDEEGRSGIRFDYEDGTEIVLDTTTLSMREQILVEDELGMPFAQAALEGWLLSAKATVVLAWIARRREQPGFTRDEVLDSSQLRVELGVVPPTTPETSGKKG